MGRCPAEGEGRAEQAAHPGWHVNAILMRRPRRSRRQRRVIGQNHNLRGLPAMRKAPIAASVLCACLVMPSLIHAQGGGGGGGGGSSAGGGAGSSAAGGLGGAWSSWRCRSAKCRSQRLIRCGIIARISRTDWHARKRHWPDRCKPAVGRRVREQWCSRRCRGPIRRHSGHCGRK